MRRRRTSERGAGLVEMAIVTPLLIILAFGVIDIGRLLYTQITLHQAVQEGSLYASNHPSDPGGARTRVVESVDNPTIDINNVSVDCPGGRIRVRATHDVDFITPLYSGTIQLTAEVTGDRFSVDSCVAAP